MSGGSYEENLSALNNWRKATYIALPLIGLFGLYQVYLIQVNGHVHRDEIEWDHLKIRTKAFPWECSDCDLFDRACHRACKKELKEKALKEKEA